MPEPLLYLKAMAAAAALSAAVVLTATWRHRPASELRIQIASLLGFAAAAALGAWLLQLQPDWPPASGLERLLAIVLPAVIVMELIAAHERFSPRAAWILRISLVAVSGRVLLHGSVYLPGPRSEWTLWQAAAALAVCALLFAGAWALLSILSARSPGVSIPLAVAMAMQTAGAAVMLAGYIKGGAASIPLCAALVGAALALRFSHPNADYRALLAPGLAGLFGIVMVGRFFGGLSTAAALVLFLAPLLCWTTETPLLRTQKPWLISSLRLLVVAVPLAAVLFAAKRDFDRDLAPLLGNAEERWDYRSDLRYAATARASSSFRR